ncbi:hypothetical protein GINT2_000232 [Glugoides intestinalis]
MHIFLFFGVGYMITLPDTCTRSGMVALTIDEGPTTYTSEILDILEKKNVNATFHFNPSITGSEFQSIYDRVDDEGHEVGFRTSPKRVYTDDQDYEDIEEDLAQQLKFLQSRTPKKVMFGRSPKKGDLPVENVYKYFIKNDIIQTSYSLCPHDTFEGDPVDKIKEFLGPNNYKQDSFIIQVYEQRLAQDQNLTEIIDAIKGQNYEIVSLSDCLEGYVPGNPVKTIPRSSSSSSKIVLPQFIPLLMYFL